MRCLQSYCSKQSLTQRGGKLCKGATTATKSKTSLPPSTQHASSQANLANLAAGVTGVSLNRRQASGYVRGKPRALQAENWLLEGQGGMIGQHASVPNLGPRRSGQPGQQLLSNRPGDEVQAFASAIASSAYSQGYSQREAGRPQRGEVPSAVRSPALQDQGESDLLLGSAFTRLKPAVRIISSRHTQQAGTSGPSRRFQARRKTSKNRGRNKSIRRGGGL